jgi:Protein of unknown function (DUF4242)
VPKFIVEREIPGAGKFTVLELQAISQKSSRIIEKLGSKIEWIQSYVTDDKVICEYNAMNKAAVEEHARESGFKCDRILQVRSVFGPLVSE